MRTDAEAAEEEAALEDELLEQEKPEPEDRPVPAVDPEGWSYQWKNGSHLARNDGRYELLFGGQVQYEGAAFHLDEGLKRTEEDGWDSDSDFRRLRAYVQGFAFNHLMFKVSYDFEDEDLKDVYAGLRGLWPLGAVQGGYMKEPFSLEQGDEPCGTTRFWNAVSRMPWPPSAIPVSSRPVPISRDACAGQRIYEFPSTRNPGRREPARSGIRRLAASRPPA